MNYLAEQPWWLPTAFILVGLVLLWTGNNRLESRLMRFGFASLLLGALLALTSYFLESDREQVVARTRALVTAGSSRDWPALRRLLHPAVSVYTVNGPALVTEAARHAVEITDLQAARVTGLTPTQPDDAFLVNLQVFTQFREGNLLTNWELQWAPTPDGWLLHRVEYRGGPGMPSVAEVEKHLRPR